MSLQIKSKLKGKMILNSKLQNQCYFSSEILKEKGF